MSQNLIYIYLILPFFLLANQPIDAQITFQKSYGYLYNDQPYDIAVASDSSYTLCGCTTTTGISPTDGYVLKVDSLGQKIWSIVVGGTQTDCLYSLVTLDDGSTVAFGNTSNVNGGVNGGAMAYLVKIDVNGNLLWSRTYEENAINGDKIVRGKDGGFVISGSASQGNFGSQDVYLAKLDDNGNILWANIYEQSRSQILEDLIVNNQGYLGVGTSFDNGIIDAFAMQFDEDGNVIWAKDMSGAGMDYFRAAITLPNGNHLLFGGAWTQTATVLSLIEVDTNGVVQSGKGYDNQTSFLISDATQLLDGSYMVIGSNFTIPKNMQGYLMKIDAAKNSVWVKTYGDLSGEQFTGIEATADSGMVGVGWTMSHGLGGDDYWIAKMDKEGDFETCTPETDTLPINTFSITPTIINPSINKQSALTSNSFATTITPFPDSDYTICKYPQPPIADFVMMDSVICAGNCINLIDSSFCPEVWLWTFGGVIPSFDTLANPINICFPTTGIYPITLRVSNELGVDSITKYITVLPKPSLNLGQDTTVCANEGILLVSDLVGDAYLWSDGTTNETTMVTTAGTYWLEVTDGSCAVRDSIEVDFYPIPTINLGNDTVICGEDTILLDATFPNVTYLWQDNSTLSNFYVTQTGNYYVKITNNNNCTTTDSIFITYLSKEQLNLGNDTILCEGNPLILSAFQPNLGYLWQNGSANSSITITESGLYWVELFAPSNPNQCVVKDSVMVEVIPAPPLDLGADTILCEGNSINLQAPQGYTYLWQDGSTNDFFWVTSAGNYWVMAQDSGICAAIDSITIDFTQPLSPTLPLDTIVCENQNVLFNAYHPKAVNYQWFGTSAYYTQNDYNAPMFTATIEGLYQVDMTNACGTLSQFTILKKEDCSCKPFIPNAFTPNNDGQNDVFSIYPTCEMTEFSIQIYDRWGNLVFQSTDLDFEWDGQYNSKKVSSGVYVWVVNYDGVGEDGKLRNWRLVGDLSVLR